MTIEVARDQEEPKPKKKAGRPSELDRVLPSGQTVEARILELVRAGASYPAAAQSCGLPQGTWENYQATNYGGPRIQRFREALKSALGDQRMAEEMSISRAHRGVPIRTTKTTRKVRMVGREVVLGPGGEPIYDEEVTVTDSTKVYWQAAAWMLERKAQTRQEYPRPLGPLHEGGGQVGGIPAGGVPPEAAAVLEESWAAYMKGRADAVADAAEALVEAESAEGP